jgi:hypothetical protein
VILTTSGLLEGNSGNGFKQWATGVKSFVVDPQTGAIVYVTTPPAPAPPPTWSDTGGHLASVVAGHGEVFGLGGDNSVWAYSDATGWANTQGHALSISVGTDAAGHDELWVVSGGNSIWRYGQGGWLDTGGHLASIVAGHGEVFGLGGDHSVWVYSDAAGWANTGGHAVSIAVGTDAGGHDELWVVAGDYGIWRYDQGSWLNTGGHLISVIAGRGEVFGFGPDQSLWVYSDATGWTNTLAYGIGAALGSDAAGLDELWLLDPSNELLRHK